MIRNYAFFRYGLLLTCACVAITLAGCPLVTPQVQPRLSVSTLDLDFGSTSTSRSFSVVNIGTGTLSWAASSSTAWITSISPGNGGNGPASVTVSINREALTEGENSGSISISGTGGSATIACTAQRTPNPPVLSVSPATLDFGLSASDQSFQVANTGGGTLSWTANSNASWITFSPTSGNGPATVNVAVNRNQLSVGQNTSVITVGGNGGTQVVQISAQGEAAPQLRVSTNSLTFSQSETQKSFSIENAGGGALQWTLAENASWISSVSQTSGGNGPTNVTVTVNPLGSKASLNADLSVTSNGGNTVVSCTLLDVPLPPTPKFSATPRDGTVPLTVKYTDQSESNGSPISSYLWNFGDGATSTDKDPVHTYTKVGTFNVSLTVTNAKGPGTKAETGFVLVSDLTFRIIDEVSTGIFPFTLDTIATRDGNFIAVGKTDFASPFVAKYSSRGSLLWTQQFASISNWAFAELTSVHEDEEGNYIGAGRVSDGFNPDTTLVVKINGSNGEVIAMRPDVTSSTPPDWPIERDYGFSRGTQVITLAGGGYAVAGIGQDPFFGGEALYVMRLNADLSEVWRNIYSESAPVHYGYAVVQAVNGDLLVAGARFDSGSASYDGYAVRIDLSGTEQWRQNFGGPGDQFLGEIREMDNGQIIAGGVAITGSVGGLPAGGVYLARLNQDGTPQGAKQLGSNIAPFFLGYDMPDMGMALRADGDVVIGANRVKIDGGGNLDVDVYYARVKASNFNLVYEKSLSTPNLEVVEAVANTNSGGQILGGLFADNNSFSQPKLLLVRTDASGDFSTGKENWVKSVLDAFLHELANPID